LPAAASYCHVEVAPDLDLLIPEITGMRVRMNYAGVMDGHNTWTVAETLNLPATKGCTNAVVDSNGNAVLGDVRGESASYTTATMQNMGGGVWRLIGLQ
jgi:hypothetical protein